MFSPPTLNRRGRAAVGALLIAFLAGAPSDASQRSNWTIDPVRTHISFSIDAIGYPRTEGEFHRFDGHIDVDFEHPARSRVSFQVDTQSIDVGSPSFGDYLRSEAFLNAARFKAIEFASTAVEKIDENDVRVTGDLTMLGVTRPLTVDVEVKRAAGQGRGRLGFTARAKIDRLDYGMNSGFPLISKDVDLVVASEAVEQ
jgi:polyisoprenoid-binding protein YceI